MIASKKIIKNNLILPQQILLLVSILSPSKPFWPNKIHTYKFMHTCMIHLLSNILLTKISY